MRRSHWVSLLAAGICAFCAGCMHGGGGNGLTEAQIERLADRILENTPEYTHFAEGTVFSWILLDTERLSAPEDLQEAVLDKLKAKYSVYVHESEVPDQSKIEGGDGQLQGYRGGFRFSYRVELESQKSVKVYYSDWEGMLAASGHWKRYRWRDGDWKIVEKSPMIVS